MKACLLVGAGGCIGAVCRYLIGMIPVRASFPVITLIINLAGAVLIGVIAGAALENPCFPKEMVLFLKTGVCGGFTTFSTFSLETLTLIEQNKIVTASAYAVVSVILCIIGVWIG